MQCSCSKRSKHRFFLHPVYRNMLEFLTYKYFEIYHVSFRQSLSMAAVTRALSRTRPATATNFWVYFPTVYLSLFQKRVSKCQPPTSNNALQMLKIFNDTQRSSCLKILIASFNLAKKKKICICHTKPICQCPHKQSLHKLKCGNLESSNVRVTTTHQIPLPGQSLRL
jgi:hypothetical protein